jgi:transcriptional repressor NrdR
MKCPFCTELENKVIDSRLSKDGLSIRRRRECLACQRRFTTYERVEEIQPLVIKSDSRREAFNRKKIKSGMVKATQKRPISIEIIDEFIDSLERRFQETNQKEIPSSEIGEQVMAKLYELDKAAYVRFASVYKPFKDLDDFVSELRELLDSRGERNSELILNGLKKDKGK